MEEFEYAFSFLIIIINNNLIQTIHQAGPFFPPVQCPDGILFFSSYHHCDVVSTQTSHVSLLGTSAEIKYNWYSLRTVLNHTYIYTVIKSSVLYIL